MFLVPTPLRIDYYWLLVKAHFPNAYYRDHESLILTFEALTSEPYTQTELSRGLKSPYNHGRQLLKPFLSGYGLTTF